jgi:hypothetical protein
MEKNNLNYLVLDIETTDAPAASVAFEQEFARPHAGTKDEDKKAAQVAAKQAKLQESAALLDSSPVCIVGGIVGGITFQIFSAPAVGFDIPGVTLFPMPDERGVLLCFAYLLESLPGVTFVGHNVEKRYNGTGFDLPHLRFRYAFHGVALPIAMDPLHTRSVDLMELYFRSSTTKKDVFVSLEEMAARLELTDKPFPLAGKDVPRLWQAGDVEACLLKNLYDLRLTQAVFGRLHRA